MQPADLNPPAKKNSIRDRPQIGTSFAQLFLPLGVGTIWSAVILKKKKGD